MSVYKELHDNLDAICYHIDDSMRTLNDIDDVYSSKGEVDQSLIDAMRLNLEAVEPIMHRLYNISRRLYAMWDNDDDMSDLSGLIDKDDNEEHHHRK